MLGPNAKDILSSGDPTEDQNDRDEFIDRYQQMHRMVMEPDGTTTLYIGAENYPVPIPLVRAAGNAWYFDTAAGKQEILFRRVGENELAVIQVCRELVSAEKEGIMRSRMTAIRCTSTRRNFSAIRASTMDFTGRRHRERPKARLVR